MGTPYEVLHDPSRPQPVAFSPVGFWKLLRLYYMLNLAASACLRGTDFGADIPVLAEMISYKAKVKVVGGVVYGEINSSTP